MAKEKDPAKLYVCADCAKRLGKEIDVKKPYMWHICEICGDGRKDLFELDKSDIYGFSDEPPKHEADEPTKPEADEVK